MRLQISWLVRTATADLKKIFRHLRADLICGQESYAISLEYFDRLRHVRVRVCDGIDIGWHFHPRCRSIHLVNGIKEAARSDQGSQMKLIGHNAKCMGLPER